RYIDLFHVHERGGAEHDAGLVIAVQHQLVDILALVVAAAVDAVEGREIVIQGDGVVAGSAIHRVVAAVADDRVVAVSAREQVGNDTIVGDCGNDTVNGGTGN